MAKYNDLTMGQVEAVVNKMGGMKNFHAYLRGEYKLTKVAETFEEPAESVQGSDTVSNKQLCDFVDKMGGIKNFHTLLSGGYTIINVYEAAAIEFIDNVSVPIATQSIDLQSFFTDRDGLRIIVNDDLARDGDSFVSLFVDTDTKSVSADSVEFSRYRTLNEIDSILQLRNVLPENHVFEGAEFSKILFSIVTHWEKEAKSSIIDDGGCFYVWDKKKQQVLSVWVFSYENEVKISVYKQFCAAIEDQQIIFSRN